jgi:hypothetical protein
MAIEIWDIQTRNAIDDFDTEEDALAFVRETIALRGVKAVAHWALNVEDGSRTIRGSELVRRAVPMHS